jgi:hypothetical protein
MTDAKKETGGPAFPRPASDSHAHGMHKPFDGMTLRDYFAAKAMQAMIVVWEKEDSGTNYDCAVDAYLYADRMLKARK